MKRKKHSFVVIGGNTTTNAKGFVITFTARIQPKSKATQSKASTKNKKRFLPFPKDWTQYLQHWSQVLLVLKTKRRPEKSGDSRKGRKRKGKGKTKQETRTMNWKKLMDIDLEKLKSSTEVQIAAAGVVATITAVQLFTEWDPVGRCLTFHRQLRAHEKRLSCHGTVDGGNNEYQGLHAAENVETRNTNYKKLVNAYYDLATVFYEWGWGPCFHFHYRFSFESFWEATRRHEYQLAAKLNVTRSGHVLDVGCGIGGPMRNIARFLSCSVTGITLNPYQVDRGNEICANDPTISKTTKVVQGDFMELPFKKEEFDAAYAIEATCHAPDRVKCYKQVYDVLKPGARFVLYEWCMTDKYDASNPEHQFMKKKIEEGNGLPDITTCKECYKAMEGAGFRMVEAYDYAADDGYEARGMAKPWMTPLLPSWNPISQRFQFNWLGSRITNAAIFAMEMLWIAPKGTIKTQKYLQEGAFALRDAGKEKIFTTAYFMVGEKPVLK